MDQYSTREERSTNEKHVKRSLTFRPSKSRSELKAYVCAIEWIDDQVHDMKKLMQPNEEFVVTRS